MANILSSKFAFNASARSKVIEINKGILLNNHYYDKNLLIPIPYEAMNINGSRYNLSISKFLYLRAYSWNESRNTLGIIHDSKNKDRCYFKVSDGYIEGTRQEHLMCMDEKNNTITRIAGTSIGDLQMMDLIDQDNTYLYFTVKGNKVNYFYRYNKNSFAFEQIHKSNEYSYTYPNSGKLYSNETYIYLVVQQDTSLCTYQYNKITKTIMYTASTKIGSNYCNNRFNDPVYIENSKYGFYFFNADKYIN